VPAGIIITLPYVEALNNTPGTFFQDYQWNLNSIFDPNLTGTGHQPLGYDQWSAFYGRYRVLSVRVQFTAVNFSTVDTLRVLMAATNSITALDTINAPEQPNAIATVLSIKGGNDVVTLDRTYDLPVVNGRTLSEYRGSDTTQSAFGTSPTERLILHCFLATITGGNVTAQTETRMWYTVELFDPLELTES
jgi:hypothetical protein